MTATEFLSQFVDPDPRFGPIPAWWWSGDKLSWDRMQWQMDQMFGMGIRNLVIINLAPNGTLFASEPDDPPFLSELWWDYFRKTCDYAAQKGMKILFYDQIGFSGANFQADLIASNPQFSALQLKRLSVEGHGRLSLQCPGAGQPLAAYLVKDSSVQYVELEKDKSVVVHTDVHAKLSLVYTVRQGFDLFSVPACQALLDTVHRQFEKRLPDHIGKTIIGSFQDELPELPTWGVDFAESFKQTYGYDLPSVIHRLFEPGDDQSRLTRIHYHSHRAQRAERSFFKPFYEWHESHGMACGFDQQSPAREARVLGCTQKYADYMRVHQWYGMPGCDLHGNGKLHSSIAHLHRRKRVWLEGFHSTGWGGTIADTFDWLLPYLRSGSNLYNPHAIYYSTRKGWWEWAPPSTCWRQPYAMHYKPFAEMIARLCKLLTQGVHQATAGVLFPTTTVQSALGPWEGFDEAKQTDQVLHETIGSMRWHQEKIGPLDEIGIDYHLLNDQAIASATLTGDRLDVAGTLLQVIILPKVTAIDARAADKLIGFARQGGKIISINSARALTTQGQWIEWSDIGTVIQHADQLKDLLQSIDRPFRAPVQVMHRKISEDLDLLFVPAITGMATVVKWPGWFEKMEHTTIVSDRYAKELLLQLPEPCRVFRFDPTDGSIRSLSVNNTQFTIDFEGCPFAVLVVERQSSSQTDVRIQPKPHRNLPNEWQVFYHPTLPQEFVDTHDPLRPELCWPHTTEFSWEMTPEDRSAGLRKPEAVLSGFGGRAWKKSDKTDREPVIYSPEFGIAQDRLHIHTLGPKGHVPEEFIDLGKISPDDPVTVHVAMEIEKPQKAILMVGSSARKHARLNGKEVGSCIDRYQWVTDPLSLESGRNELQLTLAVAKEQNVRLWWCWVDPQRVTECVRPERIWLDATPVFGTKILYRRVFDCATTLTDGQVKVSVAALAKVWLDGKLIGQQGGCDPYRPMMRGNVYKLPELSPGNHTLEIELLDPGARAALMVDFLAKNEQGDSLAIISDDRWEVSRDAGPWQKVSILSKPEPENAAWGLYRRPHPLPASSWIEGPQSGAVLDIRLCPILEKPCRQWLEWVIPPGAVAMRLPLAEYHSLSLWIDGLKHDIRDTERISLPGGPCRRAILSVDSAEWGGGLLKAPVTYQWAEDGGLLYTGSWLKQGLRSYSGAIRMHQHLQLTGNESILDLGRVRGTVQALVNGKSAGVRFMSPYRFDISAVVTKGDNHLELVVTNTLVNHLSTWSPSGWWSADQLECGVFGPVRIG
ncbi:MAG: hypothetical protein KatS3mg104_0738 [Phycisphaerae bacterium]|jgi:hypothetical protein|nr:MAG: hypothetical protein KatS3mg104_0738 [Phycisphaerae bacterium]